MKSLTAITIISVAVMIMASAGYYFYNNSINESSYPSYHVDMHLNATNTSYYPIHVNSNLTGNGTYQQLLTISDPSHYGINANGSNIAFYDGSNQTQLYAWEQSINSTAIQVWVKNYNGSNIIDMRVLPFDKNLFNATGYLGEAPQLSPSWNEYNNYKLVGLIYIPATTVNFSLFDSNSAEHSFFYLNGYIQGWQSNNTVEWVNDTHNVATGGWWYGPYQQHSSGSFNVIFIMKLIGSSSSTTVDHIEDSYALSGVTLTSTTVYGTGSWQSYDLTGAINDTTSSEEYRGGIDGLGSFSQMFFAGVYIAYYSDSPSNNEQNPTIASMPTYTIGSFTNMTDHAVASYLSNSITIPMPNWFNLTLKAYTNYSFTFHYNNMPLYFTYDGLINNTIYTGFLDSNLTLDIHFIALGYSGKTELIVGEKT